jgi:hypothetical protein
VFLFPFEIEKELFKFTSKMSISLADLKALAKKVGDTTSGTRTMLAERISNLRGQYLTKAQIEKIKPFLKRNTKNKKILLKINYPAAKKKALIKSKLAKKRRQMKK